MQKFILTIITLAVFSTAQAKPAFNGQDFTGVYDCVGEDAHEGKYKGVVTLTLNPAHSSGQLGSYSFKLEAENFGVYLGEAAADGNKMAIHFALNQPNSKDHGTGIATFNTHADGRVGFHKFYYEREYKGGNHGTEDCVKRGS